MTKLLRLWRESQGISQADFAKTACIQQSNLCAYELGHRKPRPDAMKKLSDASGFEMEELYDDFYGPE